MARHEQSPQYSTPPPDSRSERSGQPLVETTPDKHTLITPETEGGGAIYPFLAEIGRDWHIVTRLISSTPLPPNLETFNMPQPTLRWVNGSHVVEVFVAGMTSDEFFRVSGLAVSLDKGGFVLSKRLSRIFRPYFVQRRFPKEKQSVSRILIRFRPPNKKCGMAPA